MTIMFIDIETTGLDPDRHSMWELALVTDGMSPRRLWQFPVDCRDAEPAALRVGRYFDRAIHLTTNPDERWTPARVRADIDLNSADLTAPNNWRHIPADTVARDLARMLSGATLAGANVQFDAAFLARWLNRAGWPATWHHRLLDVEAYAAGRLGWDRPRSLTDTCAALDIDVDHDSKHTALYDARLVRLVWDRTLVAARSREKVTA